MLIGFGCTVPGVMASRTPFPLRRDRKNDHSAHAVYMSCSAKAPHLWIFYAAFFPGRGGLSWWRSTFGNLLVGILMALLSKRTIFKGEAVPFVMELPSTRCLAFRMWRIFCGTKPRIFFSGHSRLFSSRPLWSGSLQTFDFQLNVVADSQNSILAVIAGGDFSPLFVPLGSGDWRVSTALIAGFMAKESVVPRCRFCLAVRNKAPGGTDAAGLWLLSWSFCLLYTPLCSGHCFPSTGARRKMGGRSGGWTM